MRISWDDIPHSVRELICDDMDLDYDPYEDSREECTWRMLLGYEGMYDSDRRQVDRFLDILTEDDYMRYIEAARTKASRALDEIADFAAKLPELVEKNL